MSIKKRQTKSKSAASDDNDKITTNKKTGKTSQQETKLPPRPKKKKNGNNNPPKTKKHKLSTREIIPYAVGLLTLVGTILGRYYLKYGITFFLGHAARDYSHSPTYWRKLIDGPPSKTILLIGGPHRSGTTIIWRAVTSHPDVCGFGSTRDTGVDYSEGVLMQSVYPRFGIGLEFRKDDGGGAGANRGGLGQYALMHESRVHWTKDNRREELSRPDILSRLLNRFGPYWDNNPKFARRGGGLAGAKVWVEKSPQNAVLSSFLEGLYNLPVLPDGTIDAAPKATTRRSVTKFLFVTRHPVANAYAHEAFMRDTAGKTLPFETYVKNYIKLHQYMRMDEAVLESSVMWVRLEDFVADPAAVLTKIYSFLDLNDGGGDGGDDVAGEVLARVGDLDSNPNGKYMKKWCKEGGFRQYSHLVDRFDEEIVALDLGYDLKSVCMSQ